MILDFAMKNVLSFKEGVEVSFRNGNIVNTILCIKGANGSGKTNLLYSLSLFLKFVADSFSLKPDAGTGIHPFFDSQESSLFRISFLANNIEYCYEIEVDSSHVIAETLFRKKRRMYAVIVRENNNIIKAVDNFKDFINLKLRSNASMISTAIQNELSSVQEIKDIFSIFWGNASGETNSLFWDCCLPDRGTLTVSQISSFYGENDSLFTQVKKFICSCDLGITDIRIMKETRPEDGKDIFIPIFLHEVDGEIKYLGYNSESNGTRYLFTYLVMYFCILNLGGFLIFDELDMSLHSDIIPKLLDLFRESENPHKAQLIFSTHNNEIMDKLDASQIFLVNKSDNKSFGYSIAELPSSIIRKDRSLRTPYEQNKIGGKPNL